MKYLHIYAVKKQPNMLNSMFKHAHQKITRQFRFYSRDATDFVTFYFNFVLIEKVCLGKI